MSLDRRFFEGVGDAPPRPHDNCYWLLPGRLLAGEYPGLADTGAQAERLNALLAVGVREVLNLTHSDERLPDYGAAFQQAAAERGLAVHLHRVPVTDFGIPDAATMRRILGLIDAALNAERPLYVHCHGGIGRTGTVVGCLLVEQGFTADEALAVIARKWRVMAKRDRAPESPETDRQRNFIRRWPASG